MAQSGSRSDGTEARGLITHTHTHTHTHTQTNKQTNKQNKKLKCAGTKGLRSWHKRSEIIWHKRPEIVWHKRPEVTLWHKKPKGWHQKAQGLMAQRLKV